MTTDKSGVRRGHAILKGSPATTIAKFEQAIDDADDLVLDGTSDGVYLIYEQNVSEEEDNE